MKCGCQNKSKEEWLAEGEANVRGNDGDKAKATDKDGNMDYSDKHPEAYMFTSLVAFALMRPYVSERFESNRLISSLTMM
jgi:hypothetical protein